MNSRQAGEILLKAQTVTNLYFDGGLEDFWTFEQELKLMWGFTEKEISIIWDIFLEMDQERE